MIFFKFFYNPGTGKDKLISLTLFLSWVRISSLFLFFNAWSIYSTMCFTSSSLIPLVVIAGKPILSPDGRNGGFGSSGIVDFEVEIQMISNVFSAMDQSNPPCGFHSVHEKSIITI